MSTSVIPGNYYIVNAVADTTGSRLAIQFNGEGNPLTLEALVTGITEQMWSIANYDSTQQTVSPLSDTSLQVAFGSDFLTALTAHSYTWIITGDGANNYTFQDGGETVYWDVAQATPGQNVTTESQDGAETQMWWLYPA